MNSLSILLPTAFSIAFFHTALGPDHYLPFIVMSKARNWNAKKLVAITLICGIGHVLSSVLLGFIGIRIGAALVNLELIESFRGELAGWFLLIFGFFYFIYGIVVIIRNKLKKENSEHTHRHGEGNHVHIHNHNGAVNIHEHENDENVYMHTHGIFKKKKVKNITPWILFTIFLLGPCEPLIPLLMYPAAALNTASVFLVVAVFGVTTTTTMLTIVLSLNYGLKKINITKLEKYTHALAGFTIFLCGFAVNFLGL